MKELSLRFKSGARTALTLAALGAFVFLTMGASKAPEQPLTLTILHTNDLHSHDESYIENGRTIGGLPRIGHMIRFLKERQPNALAIDAGDIFQGTPMFTKYQGEVEVSLLDKIGYDLYTIGNHEFDDGPQNLAKQLNLAHFPILNCNIDASAVPELERLIKPYVIKEIKGEKVAFIGAITPELESIALNLGGVKLKSKGDNWSEPIGKTLEEVEKTGVDKIVLVTHCGVEHDKELAQKYPQIDLIIGGHSHTRLDEPIVVQHADGSSTFIVQTGCFGRALGDLTVTFDEHGHVEPDEVKYHLINIGDRIFEDQDLKAFVDEKEKPLLVLRTTILGQAKGPFDNQFRNMHCDSALGDLVCDALIEASKNYGATISFQNRGGIRGRIEQGPISLEKVQELLPFDNRITCATITGANIFDILEHSLSGGYGGSFFDVHGLKFAYDPSKDKGHRLVFCLAKTLDGRFEPVDKDKQYKVVVNSYNFDGGESYDFSRAKNIQRSEDRIDKALTEYLKKEEQIAPTTPHRLVPVKDGIASIEGTDSGVTVTYKKPQAATQEPAKQSAAADQALRVFLYAGEHQGVTTVPRGFTIPLDSPRLIASWTVTPEDSECQETLKFTYPPQPTAHKVDTKLSYCLAVQHGHTSHKMDEISYPLTIK